MTTKNKIYLVLSIVVFMSTIFSILTSSVSKGVLDNSLSIQWIILFIFILVLPIFNLAEIIINRDDWNKFYWIGLIINMLTIIFVMRFFDIKLI